MLNITHNQDYMAALRYANSGNSWACGLKTDGSYFISSEMGANGGGGTDRLNLTTTSATFSGTVSDSKGNLRDIPRDHKTSSYTLVATDAGKVISSNSGVTVNNNVMSNQNAVTILNTSGSDITITQGSGLTMYNSADATTGNRTLAGSGMATLYFISASDCYISGAGLS